MASSRSALKAVVIGAFNICFKIFWIGELNLIEIWFANCWTEKFLIQDLGGRIYNFSSKFS